MKATTYTQHHNRRIACPQCKARKGFAPLINDAKQGHCFACGYKYYSHQSPTFNVKSNSYTNIQKPAEKPLYNVIGDDILCNLLDYDYCNLMKYLNTKLGKYFKRFAIFGDFVLTDFQGYTLFPYYDETYICRSFKRVNYTEIGKRNRNVNSIRFAYHNGKELINCSASNGYNTSLLYGLQQFSNKFNYYDYRNNFKDKQVKYHNDNDVVVLVESEKSALIAKFFYPYFIWLGTGGASGLTSKKVQNSIEQLKNRTVLILFDNDKAGIERAASALNTLQQFKINSKIIKTSNIITSAGEGDDIADYLLYLDKSIIYNIFYK